MIRGMAKPKPAPKALKDAPAHSEATMLRGLTDDDWAGIDRARARRQKSAEAFGATVSQNSALLALLRAGIAADDAAAARAET